MLNIRTGLARMRLTAVFTTSAVDAPKELGQIVTVMS